MRSATSQFISVCGTRNPKVVNVNTENNVGLCVDEDSKIRWAGFEFKDANC